MASEETRGHVCYERVWIDYWTSTATDKITLTAQTQTPTFSPTMSSPSSDQMSRTRRYEQTASNNWRTSYTLTPAALWMMSSKLCTPKATSQDISLLLRSKYRPDSTLQPRPSSHNLYQKQHHLLSVRLPVLLPSHKPLPNRSSSMGNRIKSRSDRLAIQIWAASRLKDSVLSAHRSR